MDKILNLSQVQFSDEKIANPLSSIFFRQKNYKHSHDTHYPNPKYTWKTREVKVKKTQFNSIFIITYTFYCSILLTT